MMNGCRLVLPTSDSCRSQIIRTGRRVCQTSSARYGSTVMSFLPPKAPPLYPAVTLALLRGPRRVRPHVRGDHPALALRHLQDPRDRGRVLDDLGGDAER